MFLQASVILLTWGGGVCLSACPGYTPSPRADTPRSRHLPRADTPQEQTPPKSRHPPRSRYLPTISRLRHTVNERPVRILLECILVMCMVKIISYRNLSVQAYKLLTISEKVCLIERADPTLRYFPFKNQGSHFFGLTKFHDISMIFPGFLVNFQVIFHCF